MIHTALNAVVWTGLTNTLGELDGATTELSVQPLVIALLPTLHTTNSVHPDMRYIYV